MLFYCFSPRLASELLEETLTASESEDKLEDDDPHDMSRPMPSLNKETKYVQQL